jgi:leucyl-tRNA synthetase
MSRRKQKPELRTPSRKQKSELQTPSREDQQRIYDKIELFMHCRNCMARKPDDVSPAEWVQMEAGLIGHGTHLVIWCKRCKMVINIFELKHQMQEQCCVCGKEH